MKKTLLFISSLIFLFLVNINLFNHNNLIVYGQNQTTEYPDTIRRIYYEFNEYLQENQNTYEFRVGFILPNILLEENINDNEYFLISDTVNINFRKGLDRRTNSYEYLGKIEFPSAPYTQLQFQITVVKSVIDENYTLVEAFRFFQNDVAMYIFIPDEYNVDYNNGYDDGYDEGYDKGLNTGYNNGYNDGYDIGYEEGKDYGIRITEPEAYQDGYNKGAEEAFIANLHIWIVPAMILVIATGIFVGYRRRGES